MSNIKYENFLSSEEFSSLEKNFLNQSEGHDEEFLKEIMKDGGSIQKEDELVTNYENFLSSEDFNTFQNKFLNQSGGHDEEFLKEIMQDGGSIQNELKALEKADIDYELEELKKVIEDRSKQQGGMLKNFMNKFYSRDDHLNEIEHEFSIIETNLKNLRIDPIIKHLDKKRTEDVATKKINNSILMLNCRIDSITDGLKTDEHFDNSFSEFLSFIFTDNNKKPEEKENRIDILKELNILNTKIQEKITQHKKKIILTEDIMPVTSEVNPQTENEPLGGNSIL
jgi:hypothetical protein